MRLQPMLGAVHANQCGDALGLQTTSGVELANKVKRCACKTNVKRCACKTNVKRCACKTNVKTRCACKQCQALNLPSMSSVVHANQCRALCMQTNVKTPCALQATSDVALATTSSGALANKATRCICNLQLALANNAGHRERHALSSVELGTMPRFAVLASNVKR